MTEKAKVMYYYFMEFTILSNIRVLSQIKRTFVQSTFISPG